MLHQSSEDDELKMSICISEVCVSSDFSEVSDIVGQCEIATKDDLSDHFSKQK